MEDSTPAFTPATNREALSQAWRFARTRYWRSLPTFGATFLVLIVLVILQKLIAPGTLVTHPVQGSFPPPHPKDFVANGLLAFFEGWLMIGVNRSFWRGLSANDFRTANLLWGAKSPGLWPLPVVSAGIAVLYFSGLFAFHGRPGSMLLLLFLMLSASVVLGYAYALAGREGLPAVPALRLALGVFERGRRRLIGLYFQAMAWSVAGAVGLGVFALPLIFAARPPIEHPLGVVIGAVALILITLALIPLMFLYLIAVNLIGAGVLMKDSAAPVAS